MLGKAREFRALFDDYLKDGGSIEAFLIEVFKREKGETSIAVVSATPIVQESKKRMTHMLVNVRNQLPSAFSIFYILLSKTGVIESF